MYVRNMLKERKTVFAHTVCLSVLSTIAYCSPVIQHKAKNAAKLLKDLQLVHSYVTANTIPLYRGQMLCEELEEWKLQEGGGIFPKRHGIKHPLKLVNIPLWCCLSQYKLDAAMLLLLECHNPIYPESGVVCFSGCLFWDCAYSGLAVHPCCFTQNKRWIPRLLTTHVSSGWTNINIFFLCCFFFFTIHQ